jgi:azurin
MIVKNKKNSFHFQASPHFSGLRDLSTTKLSKIGQEASEKAFTEDFLKRLAKKSNLQGIAKDQLEAILTPEYVSKLFKHANLQGITKEQLEATFTPEYVSKLVKNANLQGIAKDQLETTFTPEYVSKLANKANLQGIAKDQLEATFTPEYVSKLANKANLQGIAKDQLEATFTPEYVSKLANKANLQGIAKDQLEATFTPEYVSKLANKANLQGIAKDQLEATFTPEYVSKLANKANIQGIAKDQLSLMVDEELLKKLATKSNLSKVAQEQLELVLSNPQTTNLIKAQIYNVLTDPDLKNEARNAIIYALSDPRNQHQLQKYLEEPELHKSVAIFLFGTGTELAKRAATTPYRVIKQFNDNSPALTKLGIGTGLVASSYMIAPVISSIADPLASTLKHSSIISAVWGGGDLLWNNQKNKQIWNNSFEKTPIKLLQLLKKNSASLSKLGVGAGLAAAYQHLPSALAFLEGPASTLLKAGGVGAIGLGLLELAKQYKNKNTSLNQLIPFRLKMLAIPLASAASTGITAYVLQAEDPEEQSGLSQQIEDAVVSLSIGTIFLCGTAGFFNNPRTKDEWNSVSDEFKAGTFKSSIPAALLALATGKYLKTHQ